MSDFASRRMTMVDTQVRPSDVTKFPIIDAMLQIAREKFVPDNAREAAYMGNHVALGQGRVLLDARSFAKMLDALDLGPEDLVLDVGAGLGYTSAVIARISQTVVGVEENEDMAREAQDTLAAQGIDNAVIVNTALHEGAAKYAPFDAIVIAGGIEFLPDALAAQLKEGGRICAIFMEGALGTIKLGLKVDGKINWSFAFNGSAPLLPGFKKSGTFKL